MSFLKRSSNGNQKQVHVVLARKEVDPAELKKEVSKLYARNDALERENRALRIRNGEIEAAYNSLREILRNRGVLKSSSAE